MAAVRHISHDDSDIQRIDAAPLHLRLPAVLIDGAILAFPATALSGSTASSWFAIDSVGALAMVIPALLSLSVAFLPGAILLAVLEWLTGKTAGKPIMGTRVIGVEDGEPIGLIRAVGRRAFIIIESYMLFIPSLILLAINRNFDGHLGDRLTGAIVVRDRDIARASQIR